MNLAQYILWNSWAHPRNTNQTWLCGENPLTEAIPQEKLAEEYANLRSFREPQMMQDS